MTASNHADVADRLHTRLLERCWPHRSERAPADLTGRHDRLADLHIQAGYRRAAELLAQRAEQLRASS